MASFEQLRRRFPDILGEREPLILRLRPPALFYSVRIPKKLVMKQTVSVPSCAPVAQPALS